MKNAFRRLWWAWVVMLLLVTLLTAGVVYANGSSAEGYDECPVTASGCYNM